MCPYCSRLANKREQSARGEAAGLFASKQTSGGRGEEKKTRRQVVRSLEVAGLENRVFFVLGNRVRILNKGKGTGRVSQEKGRKGEKRAEFSYSPSFFFSISLSFFLFNFFLFFFSISFLSFFLFLGRK